MKFLFLLFSLAISVSLSNEKNYCSSTLCPKGVKHIACGHLKQFNNNCPKDAKTIIINDYQKKLFVDTHNSLRNEIALGVSKVFKSAAKMLSMSWDDELANLALLNVMQCKAEHESCNSTPEFHHVGQNIAIRVNQFPWDDFNSINRAIVKAINNWFNEIKMANQNDIDKCCRRTDIVGHFTQIVQENAHRIGCAISQFSENRMFTTLITCN
jgi:hypothetical protein